MTESQDMTDARNPLRIAVVGAGPAGLTLALLAAEQLPQAQVTLFDARPLERDVSADARTLALRGHRLRNQDAPSRSVRAGARR